MTRLRVAPEPLKESLTFAIVGNDSHQALTAERCVRSRLHRSRAMPLSGVLTHVLLTRPCPHCGHKLEKKGSWFQAIARYQCEGCYRPLAMTRDARIELFEAHADPAKKPAL